jgi:hypothetical protein
MHDHMLGINLKADGLRWHTMDDVHAGDGSLT